MADKQYDVRPELQRIYEEKQKLRDKLRQFYLARVTSPYPNFQLQNDPAVDRYHAMITYRSEHHKLNGKNLWIFISGLILPIAGTMWLYNRAYNKKEQLYRSGKVAYKDRTPKIIM